MNEKKLLARYRDKFQNYNLTPPRPPGIRDQRKFMQSCSREEIIFHGCDSGWEIQSQEQDGKNYFIHSRYTNKFGKLKKHKVGIKTVLDTENMVIKRIMFPLVDPNLDIYELGFSFYKNEPIPNKFETFWHTRKGKRYSKYIQYRKYREMIKEQHNPETADKPKKSKKHDAEFEKYLVEKNEKKRILQQLIELEEEEKKMNPNYDYDSDDYY